MNNGELTAKIARVLTKKFEGRADILFDHGDKAVDGADKVGTISAWYGDTLNRDALLADLDIAVVLPQSNRVLLLIEVEESTANPKTILGDVFAALLGEHFTFQGKRTLDVGEWTTLVVLSHGNPREDLVTFLADRLSRYKSAHISEVVIDMFKGESDLETKLTCQVEDALANHKS